MPVDRVYSRFGSSSGHGPPVTVKTDFFLGGMAKNSGPNPRSFPEINYLLPPGGPNFDPKTRLHIPFSSSHRHYGLRLAALRKVIAALWSTRKELSFDTRKSYAQTKGSQITREPCVAGGP